MFIDYNVIQNYEIRHRSYNYITTSKKCIITIANKVIECAPLISALITIGIVFSLFNQIETRNIANEQTKTIATKFISDDVKMVYIGPPTRSISCKYLDICLWGSARKHMIN